VSLWSSAGAGSHIGFLERYGSNDPSLTAANPLTSKDRGTRFMACIAMSWIEN
jgi:hypothetical protein